MTFAETDPALRRFERDAIVACVATAILAVIVTVPVWGIAFAGRMALGVLGGGLLAALSYRAIKGAATLTVEATVNRAEPLLRPENHDTEAGDQGAEQDAARARLPAGRKAFLAVKFFTRYALLAVAAYVMLTCFRLHPVGVVAGVTAPFLAAVVQVGRLSRRSARQRHP